VSDPRELVREGFDALGERYLEWQLEARQDPRAPYLERFMRELPAGSSVLDLGCGPGVPATQVLAQRFDLTGVDISEVQLALARVRVPGARFVRADLAEISFPAGSFDGIVALFALSHVPRAEHDAMLRKVADWLRPGGLFFTNSRARAREDAVREWGGVQMYSWNHDAETNRCLLRAAGFELVVDEITDLQLTGDPVPFLWVIGKKTELPNPAE
jgi:ubiquinone/menaquinone biosynthesis C-methylase UbiE